MPRTSSVFATLADDVVTSIERGNFFIPYDSVIKSYEAEYDANSLAFEPKIIVRPSPQHAITTTSSGTRTARWIDLPVDVLLACRTAKGDTARIEQLLLLAEEIDAHLFANLRITPNGAQWISSVMAAPFQTEELRTLGIIDIPMTVTYRTSG